MVVFWNIVEKAPKKVLRNITAPVGLHICNEDSTGWFIKFDASDSLICFVL